MVLANDDFINGNTFAVFFNDILSPFSNTTSSVGCSTQSPTCFNPCLPSLVLGCAGVAACFVGTTGFCATPSKFPLLLAAALTLSLLGNGTGLSDAPDIVATTDLDAIADLDVDTSLFDLIQQ